MKRCALQQPKGYYVVGEGREYVLCRRDGTKVCSFDPAAVPKWEVALTAFEDHSEALVSEAMWRGRNLLIHRGT
jgi:hypothetical protein